MVTSLRSRFGLCASFLALLLFSLVATADVVPVLHTKAADYQNVTLVSHTPTHLFIQHSRGVATIKIDELDDQALTSLGLSRSKDGAVTALAKSAGEEPHDREALIAEQRRAVLSSFVDMFKRLFQDAWRVISPRDATIFGLFIAGILAVLLFFYLFYSYCVRLICLKAGYRPGIIAWLPIVRDYALFRAAGMSIVAFLVLMSPGIILPLVQNQFAGWEMVVFGNFVLVLVVHCLWCIRLCDARGKGAFAKILLIFPLTYPFAFLYLAFADRVNKDDFR
jgi:hypothetical protein